MEERHNTAFNAQERNIEAMRLQPNQQTSSYMMKRNQHCGNLGVSMQQVNAGITKQKQSTKRISTIRRKNPCKQIKNISFLHFQHFSKGTFCLNAWQ